MYSEENASTSFFFCKHEENETDTACLDKDMMV